MKALRGIAAFIMSIAMILYYVLHIIIAVVLFKHVKLWAFLVILCVPVLGDVMAIMTLVSLKMVKFILLAYGIYAGLLLIAALIVKVTE